MTNNNFFSFSSKLSSSTYQVSAISLDKNEDSESTFDEHNLIKGVYDGISFPVVFQHIRGKKLCDILDTGWTSLYLISDRLRSTLEQSDLSGWKSFPIEIIGERGIEIKGYFGLSITGRSGPINYRKSKVILKRITPSSPLSKFYKGLYIDRESWDGSDFFLPEKNYGLIITGKTVEILKRNKFTNIDITDLSEIETDEYTVEVALKKLEK